MRDHTEDTVTITLSDLDESGMSCDNMYTLSDTISSVSTTTIDTSAFDELISLDGDITLTIEGNTFDPKEFEDEMPSVAKVEDMCNDYPALAKAYEKFRSIYAMVHQDWVGKQKEEGCPF